MKKQIQWIALIIISCKLLLCVFFKIKLGKQFFRTFFSKDSRTKHSNSVKICIICCFASLYTRVHVGQCVHCGFFSKLTTDASHLQFATFDQYDVRMQLHQFLLYFCGNAHYDYEDEFDGLQQLINLKEPILCKKKWKLQILLLEEISTFIACIH